MKTLLRICVFLFCIVKGGAQNVVQAEYFVDSDAGFGQNNIVTLTNPQPDGTYSLNIPIASLSVGYHKLYIRTKDSDGNWGITSRRNIEVLPANTTIKIISGEYFFDEDPGFGAAHAITVTPQDSIILQNFTAETSSLPVGYHKLYMRLKDNNGKWGITTRRNVEIINANISVIAGAEYFFNSDPGAGAAKQVVFSNPSPDGSFKFAIPIAEIPSGAHTLYIRARDSINNNWSMTAWQQDSVVTSVQSGKWSQPATWSNNKIPGPNTVVLLFHNVDVDIVDAVCKSLTPYRNNVKCNIEAGRALNITGHK